MPIDIEGLSKEECIEKVIRELYHYHPEWKRDRIIAAAYSMCKAKKEENDFCPYDLLYCEEVEREANLIAIEEKARRRLFEDFNKPLSLHIAEIVDDIYPEIMQLFPGYDKKQLLLMAYSIARKRMDINDFIVDDAPYNTQFFAMDLPLDRAATSGKTTSSNVAMIGYDRGKLRIFFNNGSGYEYDVDPDEYKNMAAAPSKGQFVWNTLRGKTPGRVIDNPSKWTPGGVGGSLVPYFKIKGHRISSKEMEEHIRSTLKKSQLRPVSKLSPDWRRAYELLIKTTRSSEPKKPKEKEQTPKVEPEKVEKPQKLPKIKTPKKKEEPPIEEEESPEKEERLELSQKLIRLVKRLRDAIKRKAGKSTINAIKKRIESIRKKIRNLSSDFREFEGPITRGGAFDYGTIIKYKDYNNLKEVFKKTTHLPVFDSHSENRLIGFVYDFDFDDDNEYIYARGFLFNDLEELTGREITSDETFPVSIRFFDESHPFEPVQRITDVIHLAVSIDGSDRDRCSTAGGNPCYVQPVGDFMAKEEKKEEETDKEDEESDKEESSEEDEEEMEKEEEDFVKISKEEYAELLKISKVHEDFKKDTEKKIKEMNDFLEVLKKREEERIKAETEAMRDDFIGDPRVNSELVKEASREELEVLHRFLLPLEEPRKNKVPAEDFAGFEGFTKHLEELRKKWGVNI